MADQLVAPERRSPDGLRLLVVGASSGIGLAVVERGVRAGCRVFGAARTSTPELLDAASYHRCDITDPGACKDLLQRAVTHLGGLDVVIFAAGLSPVAPLATTDDDVWRDILNTNVVGAAMVIRHALEPLTEANGQAIFVSSTMVGRPWPGMVPYSVSRAALEELLRGARVEYPALRISTVTVGPTRTGFERRWNAETASSAIDRWRAEGYLSPSGRSLEPDEVACGLLDLALSPVRIDHIDLLPEVRARQWSDN